MGDRHCDQIGQFIALWATFKACGNNYFAQITHIFRQGVEIFHFPVKSFLGTFYRHLATFLLVTLVIEDEDDDDGGGVILTLANGTKVCGAMNVPRRGQKK